MITGSMSYNRWVASKNAGSLDLTVRNENVSLAQALLIPGIDAINLQRVLFGANEPGGIWDWADRSTLFQDTGGVTPVTASGQTVGLHLDRSRGFELGSNLVSNGGFDSGTGWVTSAGWSISAGVATASGGLGEALVQNSILTANVWYRVEFDVTNVVTAGAINIYSGTTNIIPSDVAVFGSPIISTTGRYGGYFLSNGTSLCIRKAVAFQGSIDNVTVRSIAGNHRYQNAAASRPQYIQDGNIHYGLYDGADDFLETNAVDFSATNKMTTWWGGRKLSDVAQGIAFEFNTSSASAGSFSLGAPASTGVANYGFLGRSTTGSSSIAGANAATFTAPTSNVVTGIIDYDASAGNEFAIRVNGVNFAQSVGGTQENTGNVGNQKLYFGLRAGTTFPANMREHLTIIRGAQTSASVIVQVEREVRRKVGISW